MKNLFTITDLRRDTTEEMITFTLQIKHIWNKNRTELIPGRINYELKKGIETELSSFSGLNDSHGYSEFNTFDIVIDPKTMKFYNEKIDKFTDNLTDFDSITQIVIDRFMVQKSSSVTKALIFVAQLLWEAVSEAVDKNVFYLLEGES